MGQGSAWICFLQCRHLDAGRRGAGKRLEGSHTWRGVAPGTNEKLEIVMVAFKRGGTQLEGSRGGIHCAGAQARGVTQPPPMAAASMRLRGRSSPRIHNTHVLSGEVGAGSISGISIDVGRAAVEQRCSVLIRPEQIDLVLVRTDMTTVLSSVRGESTNGPSAGHGKTLLPERNRG